jgi:hypothetical protein
MRRRNGLGVDERFKAMDATGALETRHLIGNDGIDQPVQRGHGRAVTHVWFVFNYYRTAISPTHDHRAATRQWSPQHGLNNGDVLE